MKPLKSGDPAKIGGIALRGRLGEGGMGTVYFGVTPDGDRVAVKMIRQDLTENDEAKDRFDREIIVLGMVAGPRIAALLAASEPDEVPPWFATEYVQGLTLAEYVTERGPLTTADGRRARRHARRGAQRHPRGGPAAPRSQARQRDPRRDGPRVIDFGLAGLKDRTGDITHTSGMLGTPVCMAPEQAESPKDLTAAADVYALGAVLMFAMTGRYPYERPTVPALLLAVTDPATDPDLSGLPEEIKPLITGMLAHHPASRRTLADVTTELKKILNDAGLSLTEAQSEFAQLTYMERDTDPPPAPPAPTRAGGGCPATRTCPATWSARWPRTCAGSTPAEQRYDPDQHPVPARRADRGPRGRVAGPQLHRHRARRIQDPRDRRVGTGPRRGRGVLHRAGDPEPVLLEPEKTILVPDETPRFAMSRLFLEATLRRTPLPQSERGLALPDRFLLDPLTYQQRPAELALKGLRPRILLADVVGLGKTLEIGLILAELIRRGRGDRILVVTPQQVLEQFQQELWTRFAIPLIRLDSVGIQRIQREIPAGRNPFTFYKRIIISIDTLKGDAYRHHLDNMHWDAVVIDESHNLIGESSLRNKLARRLAQHTDALLLASATPHNGDAESFAELISMLDPAAIADKRRLRAEGHRAPLYPPHQDQPRGHQRDRRQVARTRPVPGRPLPGHPGRGAGLRRAHRHLARQPRSRSHKRAAPVPVHAAQGVPLLAQGPREDGGEPAEERHRRARETGASPRSSSSPSRSPTTTPPSSPRWSPSSGKSASGPHSPARAVVFSESVPTLKWLHEVLPKRLGLTKPGQVDIMHGGFSDIEQEKIVERFSPRGRAGAGPAHRRRGLRGREHAPRSATTSSTTTCRGR